MATRKFVIILLVVGRRKEKMKADEMRGDIEKEPRKVAGIGPLL